MYHISEPPYGNRLVIGQSGSGKSNYLKEKLYYSNYQPVYIITTNAGEARDWGIFLQQCNIPYDTVFANRLLQVNISHVLLFCVPDRMNPADGLNYAMIMLKLSMKRANESARLDNMGSILIDSFPATGYLTAPLISGLLDDFLSTVCWFARDTRCTVYMAVSDLKGFSASHVFEEAVMHYFPYQLLYSGTAKTYDIPDIPKDIVQKAKCGDFLLCHQGKIVSNYHGSNMDHADPYGGTHR